MKTTKQRERNLGCWGGKGQRRGYDEAANAEDGEDDEDVVRPAARYAQRII